MNKADRRVKIKYRVRNKISGTAERPRLSVFRSNKQIYVQIINDDEGRGITQVVFDRNGYLYHGRIQEVANGARKGGLKF